MTRRLLLVVAATAFVGWIAWLALAVSKSGTVPIVSRAQLTAATDLIVVEVALAPDGPPKEAVKVVQVVSGGNVKVGEEIKIENMRPAKVMMGKDRVNPSDGQPYFVPVVFAGGRYRVAGPPDSPGYKDQFTEFPAIYPWTEEVQAQLRTLGLLK